jgi:hypothetical protein
MKNKKLFASIGVCLIVVAAVIGIFAVKNHRDKAKAEVTESEAQVVTEGVQIQETEAAETEIETEPQVTFPAVTATQEQLDKVVNSAQIGEVNGKTYSVINVGTVKDEYGTYMKQADTPVIPRLPIEAEGHITSFACYEDKVYYVVTEDDKWGETYSLYKCNTDFSGQELLVQNEMGIKDGIVDIGWNFIIDNGKLYATTYKTTDENTEFQCVDLKTKEVTYESITDYRGLDGVLPDESVKLYSGKAFVYNENRVSHTDKVIGYQLVDGKRLAMKDNDLSGDSENICVCGISDGWLYYYVSGLFVDGANNQLKKYKIADGTVELVDKRGVGGSSDFFQQYNSEI